MSQEIVQLKSIPSGEIDHRRGCYRFLLRVKDAAEAVAAGGVIAAGVKKNKDAKSDTLYQNQRLYLVELRGAYTNRF